MFIESFAPPPRMIIFGAVDFTAALAKVAKVLGYRVTVCDAREVFATRRRFPMADEVVVDWPEPAISRRSAPTLGPRDAVCVLTHDPKFDVPALVGALADRRRLHRRDGLAQDARTSGSSGCARRASTTTSSARVMSPIGLDIGARTPEETAISICAEIIALRTGRTPPSLRDRSGPIH